MLGFDAAAIERLFGLSPSVVRSLIRAGHVHPVRDGAEFRYSFQDLLLLRTVSALRSARVPARQINRALRTLKGTLALHPANEHLQLAAVGEHVGIREGARLWEADSGQYALPLEGASETDNIQRIGQREPSTNDAGKAHEHFTRGLELEEIDEARARAAYEACLAADPDHMEARLNLGRLLHLAGMLAEAETLYRRGPSSSALLSFNLAVLLEDLERETEAIAEYREALTQDPALADAHFNLARLQERAGNAQAAFRHLLAYRRLSGSPAAS